MTHVNRQEVDASCQLWSERSVAAMTWINAANTAWLSNFSLFCSRLVLSQYLGAALT